MSNVIDKPIQAFLDDLVVLKVHQFEIVQACRKLVFELSPDVGERMMYGGIMFSVAGEDIGGVFSSKHHVSFEFTRGFELEDPKKLLEGKGKFRRHLKLKTNGDDELLDVKAFVQQAVCLLAQ